MCCTLKNRKGGGWLHLISPLSAPNLHEVGSSMLRFLPAIHEKCVLRKGRKECSVVFRLGILNEPDEMYSFCISPLLGIQLSSLCPIKFQREEALLLNTCNH